MGAPWFPPERAVTLVTRGWPPQGYHTTTNDKNTNDDDNHNNDNTNNNTNHDHDNTTDVVVDVDVYETCARARTRTHAHDTLHRVERARGAHTLRVRESRQGALVKGVVTIAYVSEVGQQK